MEKQEAESNTFVSTPRLCGGTCLAGPTQGLQPISPAQPKVQLICRLHFVSTLEFLSGDS